MTYYNNFKSYDYADKLKKYTTLTYSPVPGTLNSFSFDESNGVVGVNVDSTKAGTFVDTFTELVAGDVIEVVAEIRNISGTKVKVGLREFNSSGNPFDMHVYQSVKQGEWETIYYKYVFRNLNNSKKLMFNIGLYTADIGNFEMRNLRVNIKTKRKYVPEIAPSLIVKPFELKKNATAFEIRTDFINGGGTLSVIDTKTLRITFNERFSNFRPVAAVSGDYAAFSLSYNVRVGNLTKDYADIVFANSSGTTVTLDSIQENCHFGVTFFGS